MWDIDSGRKDADSPISIMPTGQQLKAAITPPVSKREEKQPGPVLCVQLIICLLFVAIAAAAHHFEVPWYQTFCEQYRTLTAQGINLGAQEELVRFAGTITENVRMQAQEWMNQLDEGADDEAEPLTGKGGQNPRKNRKLPPGYSLKNYIPQEPLALPVSGFAVTSPYGWRDHPVQGGNDFHSGIDLAVAEGTPVTAALDGFVLDTGRGPSYGNYVLLMHKNGEATRYCHMQYVFVRKGESAAQGEILGTVGHTGMATGPHLHFELMRNNVRYNPAKALGL